MKKLIIVAAVILICFLSFPSVSVSESSDPTHPIYYLIINSGADLVGAPTEIVWQRKKLMDYMRHDLNTRFEGRSSAIVDISSPGEYFDKGPDDHEYLLFMEVLAYYRGGPWRHLIMQYEVINRHKETMVKNEHKSETVKSHKKLSMFLNKQMARDIRDHLPGGKKYSPDSKEISETLVVPKKGKKDLNTTEERLLKLNDLKSKGLITEKEYKEQKARILKDL